MTRFIAIATAVLLLTGCTVVHYDGPDGEARIKRGFGVVKIEPPAGEDVVRIHSKGLGLVVTPWGLLAGWSISDITTVPPGVCMAVFFPENSPAEWAPWFEDDTLNCLGTEP